MDKGYLKLNTAFLNSEPFEHIVINDFLESSYAEKIIEKFPLVNSDWQMVQN